MKDKYKNIKNKSQPGNVLIYSLLVIAAILSTTVVISNFLQTSIKQSQTIVNAQKAFYAADSGVEKLLYTIRKQEILPDFEDCSVPLSCRWEKSDKLVLERRLDLEKNKSTQIDVFNPENNDMGTKLESIGLDWQGTNTWLELSLIKWPAEQSFSWNSWQFGDEQEDLVVQKF
ncbi:MAG TPA: hypothetical protein VKP03_01830, partial [Patescibacteria group bacterium]|nr:hypothetical protein [Patescibacteria group bacterium]